MIERDDSLLGREVSLDQKICLYQLMEQIKDLKPWEKLYEDQIFAIKLPARNENAFISVSGNSGLDYFISVFLGKPGLDGFFEMENTSPMTLDNKVNPYFEYVALTCPRVQASFIPHSQMRKEDLALIRKLKLNFARGIGYPDFLSFVPGFHPESINQEEADILIDALEQLIVLFPRLTAPDANEKFYFDDDEKFLLRVPQMVKGIKVWKDDLYQNDLPPMVNNLNYSYSEIMLHQYKKEKRKSSKELEYVFLILPYAIDATERPYMMFISAFIDESDGHIVSNEMVAPLPNYYAMLEKMPSVIIKQLMSLENMPKIIWVDRDLANAFLSPLKSLGIAIEQVEELEWVTELYDNIQNLLESEIERNWE